MGPGIVYAVGKRDPRAESIDSRFHNGTDGMEKRHAARLLSVDALRGLAALGVLIFHAVGEYGHGRTAYSGFDLATCVSSQAMLRLIGKCAIFVASFGWVGVILFFVISGFCIHMRWARERALGKKPDIRFIPFWKRRFIRLYPPFFVALGIYVVFQWRQGAWSPTPYHFYDLILHLTMLHNLDPRTTFSIEGVFWTLAVEEQLYLAYFLLLWLRNRVGWGWTLAICLMTRVAWFALGFFVHRSTGVEIVVYEAALSNWVLWALGALAVEAALGLTRLPGWCRDWRLGGLCFLAAIWFTVADRFAAPRGAFSHTAFLVMPLLWGSGCFWLVHWTNLREPRWTFEGVPLPISTLARFGIFSYSLYLMHDFILIVLPSQLPHATQWEGDARILVNCALLVPLSLLFSWLFFHAFERPLLVRRDSLNRGAPVASLLVQPIATDLG